MSARNLSLLFGAALFSAIAIFTGCQSAEDGNVYVSGGMYYGVGLYDPWYYGPETYPPGVIVTPPPERPGTAPHPEHPIVKPSPGPAPAPRPLPSIPSRPRPAPRR